MSHPSEDEIVRLTVIAEAVRVAWEDRGYHVGQAVSHDPSFKRSTSTARGLQRVLVLDAVDGAKVLAGVECMHHGTWLEFVSFDGLSRRVYRVKSGCVEENGDLNVLIGSDSAIMKVESDGFFRDEPWVFVFTTDDEGELDKIFAAEVHGISDEKMPRLILGQPILLSSKPTPPDKTFRTDDDDSLPGMGETEAEEGGALIA